MVCIISDYVKYINSFPLMCKLFKEIVGMLILTMKKDIKKK